MKRLETLKTRFGNKQAIVDAHYNALKNLEPATNQTSSLRSVYDSMEQTFCALHSLKLDVEHGQNVSTIKSKLPRAVVVYLEEKCSGSEGTVGNLRKHLNLYITARESAEIACAPNSRFEKAKNGYENSKAKLPSNNRLISTTGALLSNDGAPNRLNPRCIYCNDRHWSDECQVYSTIEARKAKIKGHCFLCLKRDHMAKDCWATKPCHYCRKVKAHHSSLCPSKFSTTVKRKFESNNTSYNKRPKFSNDKRIVIDSGETSTTTASVVENALLSAGEAVYLQTATTVAFSPDSKKSAKIRILMDSGSHRSYISNDLVHKLNLKGHSREKLTVYTFGNEKARDISTSVVDLKIQLVDGSFFYIAANAVPTITGTVQQAPFDTKKFDYKFKTLVLADKHLSSNTAIDLLIGSDYYSDIMTGDKKTVSPGLYLLDSKLGWFLNGRLKTATPCRVPSTTLLIASKVLPDTGNFSFVAADSQMAQNEKFDIQKFWDLDTIGIKDRSNDLGDEEASSKFNDTIEYKDNRYYVTWPWKNGDIDLPSNFNLSLGRLNSMLNRQKGNPNFIAAYQAVLDNQLEKGIIEKVKEDAISNTRKHYVPHHAVITPDKLTTKLRIVYDGSAKARKENKSINENLLRGPVLLEDVCHLLIRFRLHPIALVADVEKAFLQIGLQTPDRDVTRFLWLKNPKILTTENNLQIYRFARVPFGIISSPFLLSATIAYHLNKDGSDVAKNISKNIYVDNMITGVDSVQSAIDFYRKAKSIFASASMNLREWASNSKLFLNSIPSEDRILVKDITVLGLNWDSGSDRLSIASPVDVSSLNLTKRTILRFIASIFDPLGLFAPVTLLGKLLLQELWIKKFDWDAPLSGDISVAWKSIIQDIVPISDMAIPRFINFKTDSQVKSLHCFCDASQKAYGFAIYLQSISKPTNSCDLIFAKSRVAPIKELSLPRLELVAVQIGCKCVNFVMSGLPFSIDKIYIWTDSQCVLHWINSKKPLPVFERNRISDIKKHSNLNFRYVPTAENPADLASRGSSAAALISNSIWWKGPSFLSDISQRSWPPTDFLSVSSDLLQEEKSILFSASCLVPESASADQNVSNNSPFGIDINRFSTFTRLLRITAYALRFINKLKRKTVESSNLTAEEIKDAKSLWLKFIQGKHFSDIFEAISKKRRHPLKEQFGLWVDSDGLLRCGGRLEYSGLSDLAVHPILLPKKDYFTILIIRNYHKKLFHSGVSHTLAEIRKEYWIPSGRSVIYNLIRKCVDCKRVDGGPYTLPAMPSLPKERVTSSPAFSSTGLDYFGPLYVKLLSGKRKVWVCLFTCLSTRAVHLELIEDNSALEFLLCLRRFIARRGKPKLIISDNAPQFKLVSSVINQFWKNVIMEKSVIDYVNTEGIKWSCIIERAPWQGGFYERLVRLVKSCLKKTLHKLCLQSSQLRTVLTEIEAVVNSRPLAYVGSDFPNGKIITPGHFLSLNPNTGIPSVQSRKAKEDNLNEIRSSKGQLIDTWKKGQQHLEQFWNLWQRDYLLNLRQRSQTLVKQPRIRSSVVPRVGDIVLIHGDGPRGNWKLARILEFIKGRDDKVRSAKVLASNGFVLSRSLAHLFPLELDDDDEKIDHDLVPEDEPEVEF